MVGHGLSLTRRGRKWVDTTPHCAAYGPTGQNNIAPCLEKEPSKVIHSDIHGAAYDPNNSNRFFITGDGGFYRATVSGSGTSSDDYTWANLNNSLSTLQFYFLDAHPTNGGDKHALDENGNPANGWNLSIFEVAEGDRPNFIIPFEIDPVASKQVYAASASGLYRTPNSQGKVFKSTDLGQSWTNISGNLPDVPVDWVQTGLQTDLSATPGKR